RELYDTLRRFSQNETSTSKQFQEEFLNRSITSRELYERLKRTTEQSGSKSLDLTSEMLRLGLQREANRAQESARAGIEDLKRGVERAAQGVLGDDAQSLRLAGEELDRLAEQLRKEMAQAQEGGTNGPQELAQAGDASAAGRQSGEPSETAREDAGAGSRGERNATEPNSGQTRAGSERQPQSAQGAAPGSQPAGSEGQQGQQGQQGQERQRQGDASQSGERANRQPRTDSADNEANRGDPNPRGNPQRGANRPQSAQNSGGGGGNRLSLDLDRLLEGRGDYSGGPITGEDFAPWSDRLREVEELVDTPSLRTEVARARERARQMRQDFKRNQKKPDWASVRLQVLNPLVEVHNEINEELARRNPQENLVPIDRDPVPGRYSELVRKYYERLGKEQAVTLRPNPEN
ncbi:MAG TPA: hypothetical protein VNT26_10735, partial [Candidatus Sulfotelmatobacter sp.]|nr:hypothetical protein [Candidatus Sulfotelmatobacter sp.]